MDVIDQKIIITKVHPSKVDLEKLFQNYEGDYKGEAFDWGLSRGEEVW